MNVNDFIEDVKAKNQGQSEFIQAVTEVAESVIPYIEKNPIYAEHKILERMVEPERAISFRVTWTDDAGNIQVNRGYRIEMNSAIGPYKGGLRFHPTVTESVLKFLAFEQVFKNSLTTLPLGGGKGGSDFDPKGKSDAEVMRFCQAFMTELQRHIGPNTDVPAGDIGVGGREIGYLFGQYKKIRNSFDSILTGKGLEWGGSKIRAEATGYGLVYFVNEMLLNKNRGSVRGRTVVVSGSGNVAQYAIEKCIELGAKVITASDSTGSIYIPTGFTKKHLDFLKDLKNNKRGRLSEMMGIFTEEMYYYDSKNPWFHDCEIALPCATQNEITKEDVEELIDNGCFLIAEGSNMSCTTEAIEMIRKNKIMYAPGKASNAGGVAVSGLEMSQNAEKRYWFKEKVDGNLKKIMEDIHFECKKYGTKENGYIDYVDGANIAGFVKVANSMIAQGI